MSFTIQDLLQQEIFPGVTLQAGQKGSRNEILWINIMEIPDTPDSVQPGELLLTTGYGLEQEEQYRDFIPSLVRRRVCGLAIQAGYYIDSIPSYLLRQADALDFPILLVPKQLTFSEFLRTMVQVIAPPPKQDWNDTTLGLTHTFLSASLAEHPELTAAESSRSIQVLLLEPVNYTNSKASVWQKCLVEIWSFLQANSPFFLGYELPRNLCAFLTAFDSLDDFLSMFYRLNINLTLLSEEYGVNYYVGAEEVKRGANPLPPIKRAIEALSALHLIRARRGVCFYDHMDFLKMFGQIHRSKERSIVLDNQHFQRLLDYDRDNNNYYLPTLRVYLSNNCNMTQTARQLFLHRHTLINRLNKIEDISGLNLNDYYSRLYMSIALIIHDYFSY